MLDGVSGIDVSGLEPESSLVGRQPKCLCEVSTWLSQQLGELKQCFYSFEYFLFPDNDWSIKDKQEVSRPTFLPSPLLPNYDISQQVIN